MGMKDGKARLELSAMALVLYLQKQHVYLETP